MQYHPDFYNDAIHEKRKALTVKQPYAGLIATGAKTIEVRSKNTNYRGSLVICASQSLVIDGYMSGCTIATVDLVGVKPLSDFTPYDWDKTRIPKEQQANLTGYGWILENPKRLIEQPTSGQLGIWTLVRNKGEFIELSDPDKKKVESYFNDAVNDLNVNHAEYLKQDKSDKYHTKLGCIILIGMTIGAIAAFFFTEWLFSN